MDIETPTPTRVTRTELDATAARLKNWGRWGPDDQVGTLNHTTPEDIVAAAGLVRKGQVISLALNYDKDGPQGGKTKFPPVGRFNPVHTMLRTGSDAYQRHARQARHPLGRRHGAVPAAGRHALGRARAHLLRQDHVERLRLPRGLLLRRRQGGIHNTKEKMVGRGVLLDIARHLGLEWLPDGYAIKNDVLDACCAAQGVTVGRGDHLLVRTGQMEQCLAAGSWDGYPGGDAPGLDFETLDWLQEHQVSAVATDTWGVRGAAQQHRRHQPALALDLHPDHGPDHGRDLQARRARARLRGGRRVRVPVRGASAADHRRGRLAAQPDRHTLSNRTAARQRPRAGGRNRCRAR